MNILAWKNLFHDRTRLAVTLTGIVFALVLIVVQFGLFLGFLETSANIVAHSGADLWISAPGIPHVNGGSLIPERRRWSILTVPGVEQVVRYNLMFVNWKLPSGAQESVQVVGFELRSGLGGPWDLVEGSIEALSGEDTIIVDRLYAGKLGIRKLGETVEMANRRARIVGFTSGIRSFTTSPYVFTSFKNSQNYIGMGEEETVFLLVKVKPGYRLSDVQEAIRARVPAVAVFTNEEMHRKTMGYWVFNTGAGVTTLMGAVLGLLVGMVVVAQTIYAATVDHIREYGTLKAMGARNRLLYRIILEQAALSAVMGYAIALAISWFVVRSASAGKAVILLPAPMAVAYFGLALLMCVAASVISIRKATAIDPALVFKT